jgi:PilZ domain
MPTIEESNRAPRIIASLTVALSEGEAHYVVDAENLSGTGLCLRPKKEFPVGTQLHMVFGQPPELPGLSAEGIVRWSKGERGVGVEFTSITADDHQAILRFVSSPPRREPA